MKLRHLALAAAVLAPLTACGDKEPTVQERAEQAEQCRDSGGLYVFEKPEGFMNAFYHCIWDSTERDR